MRVSVFWYNSVSIMKHFLSTKVLFPLFVCLAGIQCTTRADQIIYDDALRNDWQDWGWATINYNNSSPVHSGSQSISVKITDSSYQAIYIAHTPFDASPYTTLTFWINGGPKGEQELKVQGHANGNGLAITNLPTLTANKWQQFTIPLATLGITNQVQMDGFWIQDRTGSPQPTFYLDDISLGTNAISTNTITASTNTVAASTNSPVSTTVKPQAHPSQH